MRRLIHSSAAVLAMGLSAGCSGGGTGGAKGDSAQTKGASPTAVTITATDYAFELPTQIPAGVVTFKLVSRAKELHHAVVIRLDQGKTVDDMREALKQPGPLPPWAHTVGGPNPSDPGGTSEATITMAPGRYAVVCFIPSPGGPPHFTKGMIAGFEVTPAAGGQVDPPSDVSIQLSDYAFTFSSPLTAGTHRIRVENNGPQPHEIAVVQLAPGKTTDDVVKWEAEGLKAPPPFTHFLGGVSPMDPNSSASFRVALEKGKYVVICFVPDAKDGHSHAAHGMIQQISVN
jgi:hypothetical protein